jgi:hypothetical protein
MTLRAIHYGEVKMRRHSHRNELAWAGESFMDKVHKKMDYYYQHSYAPPNVIYLGQSEVGELINSFREFRLAYLKSEINEFMGMSIIHVDRYSHMEVSFIK